jgi:hypothetical protein
MSTPTASKVHPSHRAEAARVIEKLAVYAEDAETFRAIADGFGCGVLLIEGDPVSLFGRPIIIFRVQFPSPVNECRALIGALKLARIETNIVINRPGLKRFSDYSPAKLDSPFGLSRLGLHRL